MMMTVSFLVRGKFPTLNDLLREHGVSPHAYNATKKRCQNAVAAAVRQYKLPAFRTASLKYELLERNKRRDPSNVAAAAVKFIEDALVGMAVLPGDGWSVIQGIRVEWSLESFQGVCVTIEGEVCDEPRERIFKRKLEEARAKKLGKQKRVRAGAVSRPKRAPVARKAKPVG